MGLHGWIKKTNRRGSNYGEAEWTDVFVVENEYARDIHRIPQGPPLID